MNPFRVAQGVGANMEFNQGSRLGDQINVKVLSIKMMLIMRGAKGETFTCDTLFKNDSANKMLDVINTECFTIVAQKIVNVKSSNATSGAINLVGVPDNPVNAGIGTRLVTKWIPDSKFGRDGKIQYEDSSSSQVKFYDYRLVVLYYDWFGTPQDANVVDKVNDCIMKVYYKDA